MIPRALNDVPRPLNDVPRPLNDSALPPFWQSERRQSHRVALGRLDEKPQVEVKNTEIMDSYLSDEKIRHETTLAKADDSVSLTSTLDGEEEANYSAKTPTVASKFIETEVLNEPRSPAPAPHVPGPLESQLAALMSKLIYIERENPTVSVEPEDYKKLQERVKVLEAEKADWTKRHQAIWALRDEDVENNIKIRGLLAKANRDLDASRALRDEDLINVQVVRARLAEKTRELERMQTQGGASPIRARPKSFERRDTDDLFAAAKAAALEQRALELEKRNSDLNEQINLLKGGANIDGLNRITAHQAWKTTVQDLESKLKAKDVELSKVKSGSSAASPKGEEGWERVEALFEEHGNYRETVGQRLQALRSEKEALQRQLHGKEDECYSLELKIQNMRRKMGV
jgi:hypothetical protein